MTDRLVEFLLARIAEDEEAARAAIKHPAPADADAVYVHWSRRDTGWVPAASGEWTEGSALLARHDPARVLTECAAKRQIVRLHESWPVLVEQPPEFDQTNTVSTVSMRVTQRIAWLTQQEYRTRFGDEPPTTPILAALALPYAGHPDFREEWRP